MRLCVKYSTRAEKSELPITRIIFRFSSKFSTDLSSIYIVRNRLSEREVRIAISHYTAAAALPSLAPAREISAERSSETFVIHSKRLSVRQNRKKSTGNRSSCRVNEIFQMTGERRADGYFRPFDGLRVDIYIRATISTVYMKVSARKSRNSILESI